MSQLADLQLKILRFYEADAELDLEAMDVCLDDSLSIILAARRSLLGMGLLQPLQGGYAVTPAGRTLLRQPIANQVVIE